MADTQWTEQTQQQVLDYAGLLKAAGQSPQEVAQRLVAEKGLTPDQALAVATQVAGTPAQARVKAGVGRMVVGAALCVGGAVLTLAGYSAASSSPSGGRYTNFYGAIIVGLIEFFRGLHRYTTDDSEKPRRALDELLDYTAVLKTAGLSDQEIAGRLVTEKGLTPKTADAVVARAFAPAQPAAVMGYRTATVTLKDGRRFPKVTIAGGIIMSVAGEKSIPFREEDIAEIQP
jgi:hypothetical protein